MVIGVIISGMICRIKLAGIEVIADITGKGREPKEVSIISVIPKDAPTDTFSSASTGDEVNILLKDVAEDEVLAGQTLRGIPLSKYSFYMPIEGIFTIPGRGTVVTGAVQAGSIRVNDKAVITGKNGETQNANVLGVSMNKKIVDTASTGDEIDILLKDVSKDSIEIGHVLCKLINR